MKIDFILSAIFITSLLSQAAIPIPPTPDPPPDCDQPQSNIPGRYGNLRQTDPFIAVPNTIDPLCPQYNFEIAGSSKVYPIARAWATEYNTCSATGCAHITLERTTSSDGATRVCSTGTDKVEIGIMSRPFKVTEALAINGMNGYTYACVNQPILVTQIPIAMAGITVFVQKNGAAHQCIKEMSAQKGLTLAQLRYMFSNLEREELAADGLKFDSILLNDNRDCVKEWSDFSEIEPCKLGKINLYGPDTESAMYSHVHNKIFNPFQLDIKKYASETFDATYSGMTENEAIFDVVKVDPYAIGFVEFEAFNEFDPQLTAAIPIGHSVKQGYLGAAAYSPPPATASQVTIQDGTYPILKQIYMNVNNEALKTNTELFDYLQYGLSKEKGEGQDIIVDVLKKAKLTCADHIQSIDRINEKGETVFTHWIDRDCDATMPTNEFQSETLDCGTLVIPEMVTLVGSSTIFPVATKWACNYVDQATYKDKCHKVSVSAGSSAVAATAVCDGSAYIAAMSRQFTPAEATMEPTEPFTYTCVDGGKRVTQIEIGLEGEIIFVQKGSDLETCLINLGGLSFDELQYIFSDKTYADLIVDPTKNLDRITPNPTAIKYWSYFGGLCPTGEIQIYGPDSNSGAQAFFFDKIFDDATETFYGSPVLSAVDSVITGGVIDDEHGIGIVGFTAFKAQEADLVAIPLLESLNTPPVPSVFIAPTQANIRDESYPLSRLLYMNVDQSAWEDPGPDVTVTAVTEYMEYGLSLIGEEIVRETLGFVTLPIDRVEIMKARFGGGDLEDTITPLGISIQKRNMLSRLVEMNK